MDFPGSALELLFSSDFSSATAASGANALGESAAHKTEFVEAPFLIFRLGASLFGVPSLAVREIHALPALSPLQETAPFIVGVLNLRGTIVPVMDLSARFGHPAAPYRLDDSVIVMNWSGADVAIIVNEVRAVGRIAASQIEAAPTHGRPRDLPAPFIAGVTQIEGAIVMLLHLPHLLNWPAPENSNSSVLAPQVLAPRFDLQEWTTAERAVLAARAARLRLVATDEAESNGERAPVAVVALGGEEFGVELSVVREFVSINAVAAVPCCPPHILGQINLRGDIVTLVDVRPTLRTSRTAPPYFDGVSRQRGPVSVVVVQHEGAPVGIVIDDVRDVLYLREDERLALDANIQGGGQNGQYFAGGTLHEGRLLPLLDVAKLLTEGELEVDEGA